MDPRRLVRPLEPVWEEILDAVLSPALASKDVARLAPKLVELSNAYNAGRAEGRRTALPLEARIAFSFPRDVPKGAAAVRELVSSGALALPSDRPLRVLDLGAGLGAMTWGLVRALEASGGAGRVEALLVDEEPAVLQKAEAIARAARSKLTSPIELAIATALRDVGAIAREAGPKADVILVGQVLSEIAPDAHPAERLESQAALLQDLLASRLAADGALVVVEPALRERTRHLHALRDRLLLSPASPHTKVAAFAPCLHAHACPALAVEDEWCHEDLAVDLPSWVVPLARAAGLRWQGLTFSYLVLRIDGRAAPVPAIGDGALRFRAISDLLRSKGKAELWTCGADGVRRRVRRLERDAGAETGTSFDAVARGDIVTLRTASATGPAGSEAPIDERGRILAHVAIDVGPAGH